VVLQLTHDRKRKGGRKRQAGLVSDWSRKKREKVPRLHEKRISLGKKRLRLHYRPDYTPQEEKKPIPYQ